MSNLPEGTFRRRDVPMTEARAMVQSARAAGKLLCVAREDLAAPYSERARKRHEQLCAVLSSHAEIDIQLEDFFGNEIANPLSFAEIGSERRLLVVDCHYAVDGETSSENRSEGSLGTDKPRKTRAPLTMKEAIQMSVVPDSIKFSVFEGVDPRDLNACTPAE